MPKEQFIGSCDCCATEDVLVSTFEKSRIDLEPYEKAAWNLCEVCSGTFISNTVQYFNLYDHECRTLAQSLAVCTNMILKSIKQSQKEIQGG